MHVSPILWEYVQYQAYIFLYLLCRRWMGHDNVRNNDKAYVASIVEEVVSFCLLDIFLDLSCLCLFYPPILLHMRFIYAFLSSTNCIPQEQQNLSQPGSQVQICTFVSLQQKRKNQQDIIFFFNLSLISFIKVYRYPLCCQ